MIRVFGLRLLTCVSLISLMGTPLQAAQTTSAGLRVTEVFGAEVYAGSDSDSASGSGTAASGVSPNLPYIDVYSTALAQPGLLRVRAKADSNRPGIDVFDTQFSTASARWETSAVMNIPGVAPGTAGVATAQLEFVGNFSYRDQGSLGNYRGVGRLDQNLTVGGVADGIAFSGRYSWIQGSGYFRVTREQDGQSTTEVNNTSPQGFGGFGFTEVLEVVFPFIVGQSVNISAAMNGRAESQSGGVTGAGLDWLSDAGNSSRWLGLTNVSIGGNTVNNFSFIDNTTGDNLALLAPIPLPATMLLFCSGFAGLLLRTRQSRQTC